ncbi:NfeD family protein [Algoriphagus zhangzhouensis]|uniref:NfeD-like C-terminal, partner-binding n=1 Tax=Algoriphagus zhangzhouensis TaxID=1073327 RepID=A0A1M7Z6M7_9BACT|nr:NfeD family protein [Algoriphagus zhangzhouensis]TDY49157.1 NfeD-like partner-binding protein [Algoriphagus zhangzhouensis]SHO60515.1 NfeD-like C-terminal, partner-binding [Algoriphagus zhangzhouensis]
MTILILSSLLIIGLILLMAETLFIPGTTVVGVLGLLISLAGVAYAFLTFPANIAWWITAIATVLNIAAVVYSFQSGVWQKLTLKNALEGGVFDGRTKGLEKGMEGKAISDLKPIGKGLFGDSIFEVKSESGFISVDSIITIMKIENNQILVK